MKKIVNTYYEERLKNSYSSGLIFELEDGSMVVHAQDGMVTPTEVMTPREFKKWLAQHVPMEDKS